MASETNSEVGHAADSGAGGSFPPFDSSTYGSQVLWLAITFGVLYYVMAKVALPRIGSILEVRSDRIEQDIAEAQRLKEDTDEAIASYEQALGDARSKAQGIAQTARDKAKALRLVIKPANTFNVMCPASILANKRTERLIGRERNEITSINTTRGTSAPGIPEGTKSFKKPKPCFMKP